MVIRAPLGDKFVLVASSVPIALLVNIIRITLTGALSELVSDKVAHVFFHDVAGWVMPPLALGVLWVGGEGPPQLPLYAAPRPPRRRPARTGAAPPPPAPAAPPRRPPPARPPSPPPRPGEATGPGEAPAPRQPARPSRRPPPPPPAAPSEPAASAPPGEAPQAEHASTQGASA